VRGVQGRAHVLLVPFAQHVDQVDCVLLQRLLEVLDVVSKVCLLDLGLEAYEFGLWDF
jgi:hypothetical protein